MHAGYLRSTAGCAAALIRAFPCRQIHRNSAARPVDILVANFEAAYSGNRAPFPIYISSRWLRTGQHLRGLQLFAGVLPCCLRVLPGCARGSRVTHPLYARNAPLHLLVLLSAALQPIALLNTWLPHHSAPPTGRPPAEYALKKPNVYFVTMRQLLAWMANPIPADQLTADNLGCGNPGGAGARRQGCWLEAAQWEAPMQAAAAAFRQHFCCASYAAHPVVSAVASCLHLGTSAASQLAAPCLLPCLRTDPRPSAVAAQAAGSASAGLTSPFPRPSGKPLTMGLHAVGCCCIGQSHCSSPAHLCANW